MKILKNKAIFLIGTIFLLSLCSLNYLNFLGSDFININDQDFQLPKISNSVINITTPENKTYTEPMSGYYPGTFGFENDADGISQPKGFNNFYSASCSGVVVSEIDGHKKVFRAYDNNLGGAAIIKQEFNDAGFQNQTHGTIEYWFRVSSTGVNTEVRLNWGYGTNDATIVFRIQGSTGQWQQNDGIWKAMPNIPNPTPNAWHHMQIHFRCEGAPSYSGLGENQYTLIVNGTSSGALSFATNSTEVAMFMPLYTAWGIYGGNYAYCDAIGYSWDSGYILEDNLYEGLLLSFENGTSLDWIGYSLDNHETITILGNTSIPLPEDGLHRIQVFGNDSLGIMYKSNNIQFYIGIVNLIHPENKTYSEPMSGYYPGTFGFENDADGVSQPAGFNNFYSASCSGVVVSEIDGHKKVFRAYDNNLGGAAIIKQEFNGAGFQNQTHGTVDYWFRVSSTGVNTEVRLNWGYGTNDATIVFRIQGSTGQWQQNDGVWKAMPNIPNPISNAWHHMQIHFRCEGAPSYSGLGENQYELIVNGTSSGALVFATNSTDIAMFMPLYTAWGIYGGNYAYCDAIGYSWDPNYEIGNNLNEGLLLAFNPVFAEKWNGYSLDNGSIKTILGNTTIQLPSDGLHTIQVLINNSLGRIFKSEKKYFTIDTSSPVIIINSPVSDEFFGVTAPNYDITIIELNLDSVWYSLDNGVTNITITELIGIISQTEWNQFVNELVTIKFYANDSWGYLGVAEVTLQKDISAPISSISFVPHISPNIVNQSTLFSISADDGSGSGVSVIRYKVNDSSWFDYTSSFDLSGYSYGNYLITYQTIDAVGNVESENTLLVILVEIPSGIPPIHGFSMFLILSLIGLVSLILIKRYKK